MTYNDSKQYPVRLSDFEIKNIQNSFSKIFSKEDHVWLFGSRTLLDKKGGDIDLYIETHLNPSDAFLKKIEFSATLVELIGDQKIDIVIKCDNTKEIDIYKEAKKTGIQLV